MVTRKHTKSVKKRPPQQSAAPAQNPPLTTEQKAAKFDELMASYDAAIRDRDAAERAAEAEAKARMAEREKPTELSPDHVHLITCAMSQINLSAVAMSELAISAAASDDGQWFLVAIEDAAKLTARRCDYVMELLTGHPHFGNFLDELDTRAALRGLDVEREREAARE